MTRRTELEYALARIELDKRQLRLEERQVELERNELEVRQQLTQLNTVDLTEDDVPLNAESRHGSMDSSQLSSLNTLFTEPTVDETATRSTTKKAIVNEEETTPVEQPENLIGSNGVGKTTANASTPASNDMPNQEVPAQKEPLPPHVPASLPPEKSTNIEKLLTKFLGPRPKDGKFKTQAGSKRGHSYGGNSNEAPAKTKRRESAAIKSESDDSIKVKRRRTAGAESTPEMERPSGITESEEYDLISRYAGLFLKHMKATEREMDAQAGKNTIASRVSRLNVGKTHASITLLHREFSQVVIDHAKASPVRCALQAELEKFENALPYWSPKCKGLGKQNDRLSMVSETVQKIADNKFSVDDYEEDYDPYNEL